MQKGKFIIDYNDKILITGSNGFIGLKVTQTLLEAGFTNLRCFVRPSATLKKMSALIAEFPEAQVEVFKGNLLSVEDCENACQNVRIIIHLAAGVEKSFAGCVLNSVVTTRNLLESIKNSPEFRRFLNVSSITVYSGLKSRRGSLFDENSEIESNSHLRYEAYAYAKIKQDDIVLEYHKKYHVPYAIVRPGVVFGPGKANIMGRVGIDTFGVFMHLGGSNVFPLTYVDNCADAIILAALTPRLVGEILNIVDDDLPNCRKYLSLYKKEVRNFSSIFIPYSVFYFLCFLWEKYSSWSKGQLPPAFNRMRCAAHWKGKRFTNQKLKNLTGWKPRVGMDEALRIYFSYKKDNKLTC